MRHWERICGDLQEFMRLWERIHENLGEDSQGFMRLWERICRNL